MSWSDIERNWADYKEAVRAEWDNLSDDVLEEIGGRRGELIGRIQEAYGISVAEATAQVKAFESATQGRQPPEAR